MLNVSNLVGMNNITPKSVEAKFIWMNGVEETIQAMGVDFAAHGAMVELTVSENEHHYVPIIQLMKFVVKK